MRPKSSLVAVAAAAGLFAAPMLPAQSTTSRTPRATASPSAADTTRTPSPSRRANVVAPEEGMPHAAPSTPRRRSAPSPAAAAPRETPAPRRPASASDCAEENWRKFDDPRFADRKGCEDWVHANASEAPTPTGGTSDRPEDPRRVTPRAPRTP